MRRSPGSRADGVDVILLVTRFVPPDVGQAHLVRNTVIHTRGLALMGVLVRYEVAYRWIPR